MAVILRLHGGKMKQDNSLLTLGVKVTFYGSYKIMEWVEKSQRKGHAKYQRFSTYINWHRAANKTKQDRPYLRGTIVRSEMIKQLEEIFALFYDAFKDKVCPGRTRYDDSLHSIKSKYLRRRNTFNFGKKERCNDFKNPCYFCQLLGVFDAQKYRETKGGKCNYSPKTCPKSVRFLNFWADCTFNKISDLVKLRYKNYYDKNSRKAKSYFRIWEADCCKANSFYGTIEINKNLVNNSEEISYLIAAGLARINYISGAPCRIDLASERDSAGNWDFKGHDQLLNKFSKSFLNFGSGEDNAESGGEDQIPEISMCEKPFNETTINKVENNRKKAREIGEKIAGILQKTGNEIRIREYANAIHDLRCKNHDDIEKLAIEKKETGSPVLWGFKADKSSDSIKKIIQTASKDLTKSNYSMFFENIGETLYQKSKQDKIIEQKPYRIIGENEYYSRSSQKNLEKSPKDMPEVVTDWVITGYLEAQTPYFLGNKQNQGLIDLKILTDHIGNLKLPYEVIRGVLRRDLGLFEQGCTLELGTEKPCDCKVCDIISRCKPQDGIINFNKDYLPENRSKNRISPQSGTVDHGALFNMEIGLQGLRFPFIMMFRSYNYSIDPALQQVLDKWSKGQCFLGGQTGTGKGRFKLINGKKCKIKLSTSYEEGPHVENYLKLLKRRGYIGLDKNMLEEKLTQDGFDWSDLNSDPSIEKSDLIELDYTLKFKCPVMTNDPVAALIDNRNPDAVMFKKNCVVYSDDNTFSIKSIYCLKGEGIRGPVRFLVGKNADVHNYVHDDCECVMCKIFGSEQTGGNIIFEDAELLIPENNKREIIPVRCDHVAIDWNGGCKTHAKFDDYPLPGSPSDIDDNPTGQDGALTFKGIIWISKNLDKKSQQTIWDALQDLQNNITALGAKGSIGYGWVSSIKFSNESLARLPEDFTFPEAENEIKNDNPKTSSDQTSAIDLNLSKKGSYNPYYYIQPHTNVNRDAPVITHENYHQNMLSGKITCDLETLSPLFIPDTNNDKAFKAQLKEPPDDHKSFKFFRINNNIAISGSEIKGMVGVVHRVLTNSCFKNMDEHLFLTRRMETETKMHAGIVRLDDEGNYFIIPASDYRLPLYDDKTKTDEIITNYEVIKTEELKKLKTEKLKELKTEKLKELTIKKLQKELKELDYEKKSLDLFVKHNKLIAEYAEKNRNFLKKYKKQGTDKYQNILQGQEPLWFKQLDKKSGWSNKVDKILYIIEKPKNNSKLSQEYHKGYIKFTGMNAHTHKKDSSGNNIDTQWDPLELNITLNDKIADLQKAKKYSYPRPERRCNDGKYEYNLRKRCERVFVLENNSCKDDFSIESSKVCKITKKIRNQYNEIINSYTNHTSDIAEIFQTYFTNKKLTDGDLVYYENNGNQVINLAPVCISRQSDSLPLAKRFYRGYEELKPCTVECLEDCEICKPDCLLERFSTYTEHLCPHCSMFGTTNYKGRVKFGFARLINGDDKKLNNPVWYKENCPDTGVIDNTGSPLTLALLESPRHTWPIPNRFASIPGRKIYVNHPLDSKLVTNTPTKNNTTIEPLAKGNKFRFQIVFDNLAEWELGHLLYCLELENGMAHRLGMGKPLGLGSVSIKIKDIIQRKQSNDWVSVFSNKDKFIQKGKEKLETWFLKDENGSDGQKIMDNIRHIKDLRMALTIPESEIQIAYLKDFKAHKDFKEKYNWYERQAILCTPWHNMKDKNCNADAKARTDILKNYVFDGKITKKTPKKTMTKFTIMTSDGAQIVLTIYKNNRNPDLKENDSVSFKVQEVKKGDSLTLIPIDLKKNQGVSGKTKSKSDNSKDKQYTGTVK